MRDGLGNSMHDREASESRQLTDANRREAERVGPFVVALAVLFAVVMLLLLVTR